MSRGLFLIKIVTLTKQAFAIFSLNVGTSYIGVNQFNGTHIYHRFVETAL